MSIGSASVRSARCERIFGMRFADLAHYCSITSFSARRRTHLWGMGLRRRLRRSHVNAEQSATRLKRRSVQNCQTACLVVLCFQTSDDGIDERR